MVVNGDYRSSNYTMSSDDEVFNVSLLFIFSLNFTVNLFFTFKKFPPIKKSMQQNNGATGGLKD